MRASNKKEHDMLTTAAVAQKLGIRVRRVQVRMQGGVLPATQQGRDGLMTEQDLAHRPRRSAGWPRGRQHRAEDEST